MASKPLPSHAMKTHLLWLAGLSGILWLCAPSAVVRADDDLHLIYQEGRAAFYAKQYDLAREKLSQVLAKNPTHPETRAMMAHIEQLLGADNTLLRKSYEKVIIEKFEVDNAELSEAIQALRILAKNASGGKVIPNVIIKSPDLGKKPVTLSLAKIPLSEALNYLAQLAGARLHYDKTAVVFANLAG